MCILCSSNSFDVGKEQFSYNKTIVWLLYTAWKVSVFWVILDRIFPHSDWIRRDTPYSVSLRIQSECGKMRTRITPNTDTFYEVVSFPSASGLQLFFKKRLWHRCFLVNFAKFLRKPFPTEHLRWLLLWIYMKFPYLN